MHMPEQMEPGWGEAQEGFQAESKSRSRTTVEHPPARGMRHQNRIFIHKSRQSGKIGFVFVGVSVHAGPSISDQPETANLDDFSMEVGQEFRIGPRCHIVVAQHEKHGLARTLKNRPEFFLKAGQGPTEAFLWQDRRSLGTDEAFDLAFGQPLFHQVTSQNPSVERPFVQGLSKFFKSSAVAVKVA